MVRRQRRSVALPRTLAAAAKPYRPDRQLPLVRDGATTAEQLRRGDWILCRENDPRTGRTADVERLVERVRVFRGLVVYDVYGPISRHVRCVGVPVRMVGGIRRGAVEK